MNRFEKTIHDAERITAQKEPTTWHRNPYKWVDDEDLFLGTREAKQRGYRFFASLNLFRPTEYAALVRLFHRALSGYDVERLTPRQTQAVLLAHEARLQNKTPSTYVANKLQINRHSAYKLLKRADLSKMETSEGVSPLYSEGVHALTILPTREDIKSARPVVKRDCCICGVKTPDGTKALCWDCHSRFFRKEQFFPYKPEDIIRLVREADRLHWQEVKAYLIAQRSISAEEFDNLAHAS